MTRAKKWLALTLAALMILATTPLAVFAAAAPVATIDVADTADRGDEITVTINITAADVTALGIRIADSFDSEAFDFVSAEWLVDGKIANVDTDKLYAVCAADLDATLAADGAVFRYTLAVKDAAAYGDYTLTPSVIVEAGDKTTVDLTADIVLVCDHDWQPATCQAAKTCSKCGATDGDKVGHSYVDGTCSVCGTVAMIVVNDLSENNLTGPTSGLSMVTCTTPFGQSVKYVYTQSDESFVHIPFDMVATAEQKAVVFYFDYTKSGNSGDPQMNMDFYKGSTMISVLNDGRGTYSYYTIVDGEVTTVNAPQNLRIKLPKGKAGWVVLPLPANGTTPAGATMAGIDSMRIKFSSNWGASIYFDQFGYINDLDTFAEYVADQENMVGYVGPHDYADATCTAPKTCKNCGVTEGDALGHNYVDDVCERCGEKLTLDILYTPLQEFESASNKYTQYPCTSPYGYAAKLNGTGELHVPFVGKGSAQDEAIVYWVSAKDLKAPISMQVFIVANAKNDATPTTTYSANPYRPYGDYTAISSDGVKTDKTVTGGNLTIPAGFEGWLVFPLTNFKNQWAGNPEVDIIPGTMNNIQFQNNYSSLYFDQFGTTTDAEAFINFLSGKKAASGHNWQDNVCAYCGDTLLNTVEDGEDNIGVELSGSNTTHGVVSVDGNKGAYGKALKWFRGSTNDGSSEFTLPLAAGKVTDEALYFYINAQDQLAAAPDYTLYVNMINGNTDHHATAGKPYYFVDANGVVTEKTFSGHTFTAPKGTSGWIVVPVTSFNGNLTANNVQNLYFATETNLNSVLYMDSFGYAANLNDAITAFSQQAQVEHLGTSYNDKGNALRFGFTLKAAGITVDNYQRNIENATVTVDGKTYQLVSFGAIISNKADATLTFDGVDNRRTKKIEANLLLDYSDDTAYFTCGIKNIPDKNKDSNLYARSYYVYLDDAGNEIVVYGYAYQQNLTDRMNMDKVA